MSDAISAKPFAYAHPSGAIWRADNCPADIDFSRDGWFPIYRHAKSQDVATTNALRLVVAYDDLLRRYEGPSTLFAGDVAEIDAAYDEMVAAVRAAMESLEPAQHGWTQNDAERENSAFAEWFKERGYTNYPEHYPLITENAMHAAWQEASRRAALSTSGTGGGDV